MINTLLGTSNSQKKKNKWPENNNGCLLSKICTGWWGNSILTLCQCKWGGGEDCGAGAQYQL